MKFHDHLDLLKDSGARIFVDPDQLYKQMSELNCFIFDWDGVFNSGIKASSKGSPFSEPDSMGVNIWRFAYFLKHGKLPLVGIITGAINEGALYFAERENMDFILRGFINKNDAQRKIEQVMNLDPERTAFVWDDILDLPIAQWAGTSIQVRRDASINLNQFAESNKLVDYRTSVDGGNYAVREAMDLATRALGTQDDAIQLRAEFNERYKTYYEYRKKCITKEIKADRLTN